MGFWACIILHGISIAQTTAPIHIAHWVPILAIAFPFPGSVGHVSPLGLSSLFLSFPSPLSSFLPLILLIGLLAVILVKLAHWACIGLPRPVFFIFTSYSSHGLAGYHSCHADSLGLLPLFLGFPGPLISSLSLILLISLLAVIPAMLAYRTCYLFS